MPVTKTIATRRLVRFAVFTLVLGPVALLGACAQQPPPPPPAPVYVAPPPPPAPAPVSVPRARG